MLFKSINVIKRIIINQKVSKYPHYIWNALLKSLKTNKLLAIEIKSLLIVTKRSSQLCCIVWICWISSNIVLCLSFMSSNFLRTYYLKWTCSNSISVNFVIIDWKTSSMLKGWLEEPPISSTFALYSSSPPSWVAICSSCFSSQISDCLFW